MELLDGYKILHKTRHHHRSLVEMAAAALAAVIIRKREREKDRQNPTRGRENKERNDMECSVERQGYHRRDI